MNLMKSNLKGLAKVPFRFKFLTKSNNEHKVRSEWLHKHASYQKSVKEYTAKLEQRLSEN